MSRSRKDYRVGHEPSPAADPSPEGLAVVFPDPAGGRDQRFDFGGYADRPVLAAELALAFRGHLADKSPETRLGAFSSGVRNWFRFLASGSLADREVHAMSDVDTGVIRAFIAWLDRRPLTPGSRHTIWSSFKQLVAWLRRHRPDLVHPDLEIPFNAFPRKNAAAQPRAALTRGELDAVLRACRSDIEESWATFQEGREALVRVDRPAVARSDLSQLDLDDLGVLLAVLIDRYGGLVPSERVMVEPGAGLSRLYGAVQRRGGTARVARFLHATPAPLIPFMIAIGAQTFANPEALRRLRRDCVTDHLMLEGRVVVSWTKGRSNRVQRRSLLRGGPLSVPLLIERVLALTERLVPHAPTGERDQLFLCGQVASTREVGLIPGYLVSVHVRRFVERHGLRSPDGAPLALTLAGLRATGLTLAHEALGFDVLKTQALASHASPDTTRQYVDRPAVRAAQARELSRLQARFVSFVRSGGRETADVPDDELAVVVASGEHATASGFVCADPLAGTGPGQQPGRLCTAWLGCFTCPNAVIPLDADSLARLTAMRDALVDARAHLAPERWQLLYAPRLAILERDILPRFPDDLSPAAEERMALVPPIPVIE